MHYALACGVSIAAAQQAVIELRSTATPPAPSVGEQVRVTISMNMFVPSSVGPGDQGLKAQEQARRQMYELAAKECVLLREVIASDCRVDGINVTVSRHPGQLPIDGFSVGANVNYRITLK